MGINSSSQKKQIITHSRLGNVQLAQNIIDQQTITTLIITQALPSFQPVQKWLIFLREISPMYRLTKKSTNSSQKSMQFHFKQQTQILDLSSIFLPLQYSWKEEGFCGEGGILQIEYEGIMFDLQSEILNRREQGKYFLQTQMWFLLYKLLEILKQFQKIKKRIGNLHPKNILLDQDGQIKLITKYSLMDELDGFQQKLTDIHCSAFLCNKFFINSAPQQVDDFNKTQTQSFHQKGEIYSLGLTILAAGTLTQGDDFYKVQLGSGELIVIDQELIGHKLTSFREHYSSFLSSVIQLTLRRNPYERKSGNQIYESLKEYQKDILDLHPFLPNHPIDQRKLNQTSKLKMLSINSYLLSQDNLKSQIRKQV